MDVEDSEGTCLSSSLKECHVYLDSSQNSCGVLTPRRSVRQRTKPNKYGEFVNFDTSPTKRKLRTDSKSAEDEDDEEDFKNTSRKSTALFDGDDIEGQDIFRFRSNVSSQHLRNKVISSPNPIKRLVGELKTINETTPKIVKEKIKSRIISEVLDEDEDDGDFSETESEYTPSDAGSKESITSDSEEESDSEQETEAPVAPTKNKIQVNNRKNISMKQHVPDYIVESDNYFMMNSSKKITTSDHTLERLKHLRISEEEFLQDNTCISETHKIKIQELNQSYESLFNKWSFILSEHFNIILYGVGSKQLILEKFRSQMLQNESCVVVNGYYPSLTLKNILESILTDLLECSHVPDNVSDVVNLIDNELTTYNIELYLIIHNIDGVMLRNSKTQTMLASISQIKRVHTIASIDHINAPLMWDQAKLSKFNFSWWDITTFLPYTKETSYENSFSSSTSGALQLASLQSLFKALTKNAKGIFNLIIQYQLDNQKQSHYQGLPFEELYRMCREQFLVSSEAGLRAQLTEFFDHRAVRARKDFLVIPIDNGLLQHFLQTQNT